MIKFYLATSHIKCGNNFIDIDFENRTITTVEPDLKKICDTLIDFWVTNNDAVKYPFPFAFRDSGWIMNDSKYEMIQTYTLRNL